MFICPIVNKVNWSLIIMLIPSHCWLNIKRWRGIRGKMRVFEVSEAPLICEEVQLLSIELPKARSVTTQPLGCIPSTFRCNQAPNCTISIQENLAKTEISLGSSLELFRSLFSEYRCPWQGGVQGTSNCPRFPPRPSLSHRKPHQNPERSCKRRVWNPQTRSKLKKATLRSPITAIAVLGKAA